MAEPVYDPDKAERMSRRLSAAQAPRFGDHADHYAEKASAREAEAQNEDSADSRAVGRDLAARIVRRIFHY